MYCWVWLTNILLWFWYLFLSMILAYNFLCDIFCFGIRVMLVSKNYFRSIPSSAIFLNSLRKIGVNMP